MWYEYIKYKIDAYAYAYNDNIMGILKMRYKGCIKEYYKLLNLISSSLARVKEGKDSIIERIQSNSTYPKID
jgi:hypothetical protein